MNETGRQRGLEAFKDARLPVFWIKDPQLISQIERKTTSSDEPFGVEVGSGSKLTILPRVNPDILTWMAYESDKETFEHARIFTQLSWGKS